MPETLPSDVPIDATVLRSHKISGPEFERIKGVLHREPSFTELGVFSVMWSEHCSYKSSRVHLKRLLTTGPNVVVGPGENAGAVDIGDGYVAVFKIESHNHPSYIEPKQGAATGVGGILRDVFTMGARPIASLNSLRFGRIDHPRTRELLSGVVSGIGGYGNAFGVPTVGGETYFHSRYDGNILVNAFACGIARKDGLFFGTASGVGNPILYIGAKTGRDGIHGATMASDEFSNDASEAGEAKLATAASIKQGDRSTVQVGDPFRGKLLLEACLELFRSDLLEGIQDMGAAGLTSSSVEMAGRSENGIEIDLDAVPRRARAMTPYEILLSESQERMLLVAKRGREKDVLAICEKWDLDAAVIGRVTDTKRWVVRATPGFDPLAPSPAARNSVVVCDIPVGALTDAAPVYDRPREESAPITGVNHSAKWASLDLKETLLGLLGSPNICSKHWVSEQYDSIVRGGTALGPGQGEASVVRVRVRVDVSAKGETERMVEKLLAMTVDGNSHFVDLDPYVGGQMVVAEVCRNLVCVGATPLGLSDCLNFGSPENPKVMESFARAVDGIRHACEALAVPIVSGNVSLYNETDRKPILPTPTLAGVGQVEAGYVGNSFVAAGEAIVLLGDVGGSSSVTWDGLFGSEASRVLGLEAKGAIGIDMDLEARLQHLVRALVGERSVSSARDVSFGGLLVALAKSTFARRVGFEISGISGTAAEAFGERPSRVVLSLPLNSVDTVLARAKSSGVGALALGVTTETFKLVLKAPDGSQRAVVDGEDAEARWRDGLEKAVFVGV